MEDKNGKLLDFGDVVKFRDGEVSYEFTIEKIDSDLWVWGSDMPEPYMYDDYGYDNYHNPAFCELVSVQSWGKSKIEFRFI